MHILVTGATGYIGGRLVPKLLAAGHQVRCLVRSEAKLRGRDWSDHPSLEILEGDAADPASLDRALEGQEVAYYLIHSMVVAGGEYADRDRILAENFAQAAERQGTARILYLGGLGETGDGLSEHLASRREVEEALASTNVPVTVLRAAMIIGSGSASFEILRYLVERLPVMVTPRWVHTECQPIAVRNVLHFLIASLDTPETTGRTLDIGGPEVLRYVEIMRIMARARGLTPRVIVPVPVLTPRLSSLWIHLVTPLSSHIARPLAEGLRNRVVCQDDEAVRLMPQRLLTVRESIDAALGQLARQKVETAWSDAGVMPGDPDWAGGTTFTDHRTIDVDAPPDQIFAAICRVGGGHGYYAAAWLWRIRGAVDRLIGGPGLRRGRRDPERLSVGDALDFWRVQEVSPGRALRLRAEMKVPGEAELAFIIHPPEANHPLTRVEQTARFKPKGLLGLAYWFMVAPMHSIVFQGMLEGIRRRAERA
ncbi:MAG: SDR family oxidoreductase [Gemmatimonadota bacterium]|nr:SDR family oxidoreductase [Gemmatimonadota bacterium]